EERREIVGAAHPNRDRRDPGGLGLGVERARGLARDQRVPAVVEEPARLGQDPELLAAEPARRLGVEDRRHGDRLPLPTRSREKADVWGVRYQRPPREPPRPPPPPPPPKPPRPPPPPRLPPPLPGALAFST